MLGLTVAKPRLDYWPKETTVSDDDIVVAGISLRHLVEVCGTPAVHSAASAIPYSGPSLVCDARTAVLVVRVLAIAEHHSGARVVEVDARLDDLRLVWSETRAIGARIGARSKLSLLVRKSGPVNIEATKDVLAVDLPARLAVGDLLAIPSRSIAWNMAHQFHPLTGRIDWRPHSNPEDAEPTRAYWRETIE